MSAHKSCADIMAALRRQRGCGPVDLTGSADAYEGAKSFVDSWRELMDVITAKSSDLARRAEGE